MHLRKCSLLLLLASSFLQTLNAYVCEYKQLCHSKTGRIIDLFYDRHVPVPDFSTDQFLQLDYTTAVSKLYPTEQKVLSVLQELDKKGDSCDLIWETANHNFNNELGAPKQYFIRVPRVPMFIGLDIFFKLHEFQNVRFIAADKHRNCGFNSLFSIKKEEEVVRPGYNLTGCTFDDLAPLSDTMIKAIKRISGDYVWQQYAAFRGVALEKLKNYFSEAYYHKYAIDYTKDMRENKVFHSLCDIEMLSHILASDASRIIVYAGGAHCERISPFLENSAGFKVVNHEIPSSEDKELPFHLLAPLEAHKTILSSSSFTFPSLNSVLLTSYFLWTLGYLYFKRKAFIS